MKLFLVLLISCVLNYSQINTIVGVQDSTIVGVQDTTSTEEQFLQDIADKAFEKEAKRQKLTTNVLILIIIGLLIDDFF